jgi:hypothetical protein
MGKMPEKKNMLKKHETKLDYPETIHFKDYTLPHIEKEK